MELVAQGKKALESNDMEKLRLVTGHLSYLRIRIGSDDQILSGSNILVG